MSHVCEAVPLAAEPCSPLRRLGSCETKISQRQQLHVLVWLAPTHCICTFLCLVVLFSGLPTSHVAWGELHADFAAVS